MGKAIARILMGRIGKGYEDSVRKLSAAFSEAGFEVISTDLDDPASIVAAALQEGADHLGITILPEADIGVFSEMTHLLISEKVPHIGITAGGFLEEDKIPLVKSMGVCEFFPKGTTYAELITWAKENIKPSDA